ASRVMTARCGRTQIANASAVSGAAVGAFDTSVTSSTSHLRHALPTWLGRAPAQGAILGDGEHAAQDEATPPLRVSLVTTAARPGTTEQTLLGEGVRWDARRDELLRVDIVAGRVFRDRVTADGSLELIRSYN